MEGPDDGPGTGGGGICWEVLSLLLDATAAVDDEDDDDGTIGGLLWQLQTGSIILTSAIFGL